MLISLWIVVVVAIPLLAVAFIAGMQWSLYREKPLWDNKTKEVVGAYRLALECALQDLLDAQVLAFGNANGRLLISTDRWIFVRQDKGTLHRRTRLRTMDNSVLIRVDDGTVFRERDQWEDWRDPKRPTAGTTDNSVTERLPETPSHSSS